ncbi:MAG: YbbR-like domain-containing protein, partial [Leeuwenhoekiella sp.]
KKIEVSGIASGYDFYKYKFSDKKFIIDLSTIEKGTGTSYYYVFNRDRDGLTGSLSQSIIRRFQPDTVFFELDKNYEVKLPVTAQFEINYDAGYGSFDGLKFSPDSVIVRGPKSDIDTLTHVMTQSLKFKNIKQSLSDSVLVAVPGGNKLLEITPRRVGYKLDVDKFTEGTIAVPIQLINVPAHIKAKIFPKKVTVVFNVNFKNYDRIKVSDFKVVCDFNMVDNNSTNLTPEIVEYPDFIRDVRLREKTVQYLLVK